MYSNAIAASAASCLVYAKLKARTSNCGEALGPGQYGVAFNFFGRDDGPRTGEIELGLTSDAAQMAGEADIQTRAASVPAL